ncbi:hypothetical protein [Adhaeribacter rhizoryzae]|uniref:STAS/SEC14 domain-containing protein n=1 Tax=Adhaeribacter rhizoryzae TaxID=2607907 RepID=A0A5M6CVS7_9BACT|nr:hypothetical protein [Adhaeribacter rhizoryzae]KAA5539036.1 hypothetical protein F0145_25190 [Adhaeribacter rhizoryzae]
MPLKIWKEEGRYLLMINTASIKLIFADEVLQISIDSTKSLLRLTWQQHPNSTDYRRGYQQAIQVALDTNTKYWLTDARQVLYLPFSDQHWMYAQLFPLLERGQLLKFAILMHPETFMTTDKAPLAENVAQPLSLKKPFTMDLFLDQPSALAWLLQDA